MGESVRALEVISRDNTDGIVQQQPKVTKAKDEIEPPEKSVEPVSYFTLFRFANRWDLFIMLAGFLGAVANGATMPVFSIVFGNLMNSFGQNINDPDKLKSEVNKNVVIFIYIGIGAFFGAYLQMACWTNTATRQVNRIRHRYLGSVLRQDIGYFDTQATSGRLLQGLNEDCITIQQGTGEKVGMTVFNLSTAFVGIIVAFIRGWDMTLVMLSVIPVLAFMGFLISFFMTRFTAVANKAYAEANAIAQQALSNIRTVYSFNGEERTAEAYSASLQEPLKVGIQQGFLGGVALGVTNSVAFCAYALAMWYGGKRIADGAYTGGEVLNVLFAAIIGGFALGQAAPNLQYFTQAKAAGGRVFEVMKRQPDIDPDAPGETPSNVQGSLEFRDVVFAYPSCPDVTVFRNFSLEAPTGKTVALVGESGSGKSTAISLIERFYDPQSGQVLLDGIDIRRLQLHFLKAQLGLVSQEPTLFATTIRTNISYGKPGASMDEIIEAAKSANAHNFIMQLPKGYDTHVGEKGVQMSGGQKQRIAIARAILKNPKVLLLDEATSALDAESERIVQDALDGLMVDRTTVVVAHRLSTVIHSDIIAVVKKGHIVEKGNHQSLMAVNGAYATLVALQQAERSATAEDDDQEQKGINVSRQSSSVHLVGDATGKEGTWNFADKAAEIALSVEGVMAGAGSGKPIISPVDVQKSVSGWRRCLPFKRKPDPKKEVSGQAADKAEPDEPMAKVSFGRTAALNRPELPALAGGLVGSAALGLMMPAFALAFSTLINIFYYPDAHELNAGIRKWSLVFVGIGVGALFFAVLQSYSFNYMGQKLALRVRLMMIRALLRQEVAWYDQEKNSSGVLTSRLSADALAVKGQFGDTLGMLMQNFVTLGAGLVIAFINGWKMTLVVIGAVPLVGIAFYIQTKHIMAAATKEDESFAQANQTAAEALSNIRTVAAFSMEGQVFDLYGQKLQKPTKEAETRANSAGLGFGFSQFVLFGVYSLAFWFAGVQVRTGERTFEEVLKVFFAIFLAAMGAAQAQVFFPDVAKGKSASQHVFSIIDRKPAIDASCPDGKKPTECTGAIQLKDVTFAYPSRPEAVVFRRFNLEVCSGKTAALVGESGSGKSTVIGLIERFYDPLSGHVMVDGIDIRDLNLRWLRDHVALVSQEPVLFNMTVSENIRYGRPEASLEQVMEASRAANAHNFIEALSEGYDTRVGESGIQLSGGQKQRVAIARAIIKNPKILLLDEATSALDAESEHVVQEALDRLMVGRTTIVVAHRLSTVKDADSIAVVSKGRIIEQGSHEELMTKPGGSYARLVQHQMTS